MGSVHRTASVTTAPTNVVASDGILCTGVNVSWTNATGATTHRIFRNAVNNFATATALGDDSVSPFTDLTATPATLNFYWVRGLNGCGLGPVSAPDTGVRGGLSGPVTGVRASDGTVCTAVRVTWNAVLGAVSYDVLRSTTLTGTYTRIATVATTMFDDTTAAPGSTLFYEVKPNSPCATGVLSAADSGRRGAPPGIPTGIDASDDLCLSIEIDWNDVSGATGYTIWRATTSLGVYSQIGTSSGSFFIDSAVGFAQVFYKVKANNACGSSGFSASNAGLREPPPCGLP